MSVAQAIAEIDELRCNKKVKEVIDVFETKYNSEEFQVPDLLWRYAASLYDIGIGEKDKAEHKRLLTKGLDMSKLGLDKDENNAGCNKVSLKYDLLWFLIFTVLPLGGWILNV